MNNRLLGTLGILSSPMLLIEGLRFGFESDLKTNQFVGALSLIFIGGWACSVFGLRMLKATGDSVLGKAILFVQLIGLALAGSWAVFHIVAPNPDTESLLYQITDAAWPFSVVFMIIVGLFTLMAKTWQGWQKFMPLLCGLALPVAILAGIVAGEKTGAIIFSLHTTVAWMLLGLAVRTGNRSRGYE